MIPGMTILSPIDNRTVIDKIEGFLFFYFFITWKNIMVTWFTQTLEKPYGNENQLNTPAFIYMLYSH